MAASVAGPGDGSPATSFVSLPAPASGAFSDPDVASFLKKWDLAPNARVLRFRYTKPFHRMDASAFLRDFFSSSAAREHFRVVDRAGTWRPIAEAAGADAGAKCVAVDHALVPCDAVSMSLFDPIRRRGGEPADRAPGNGQPRAPRRRRHRRVPGRGRAQGLAPEPRQRERPGPRNPPRQPPGPRAVRLSRLRAPRPAGPCASSRIASRPTSTSRSGCTRRWSARSRTRTTRRG